MNGRMKFCTALAAAVMALSAAGAVAVAASTGGGVIQACANNKNGALRLLTGRTCPRGYRAISWNKQGLPGVPGRNGLSGQNGLNGANGTNGATTVTVRTVNGVLNETCVPMVPFYNCATTATLTASCNPGEKATGGGFMNTASTPLNPVAVLESRPNVTTGTPTGWQVTVTAGSTFTPTPTTASLQIPVYVICAAP